MLPPRCEALFKRNVRRNVMEMETLILASASPRRKELLCQIGVPFEICVTDVNEETSLPAEQAVAELSRRKAEAAGQIFPGRFILAADTLVAIDGENLGKPRNEEEAAEMLRRLSGRTHQVCTGVTVINPSGERYTDTDVSHVTFAEMSEEEIRDYAASGEPLDKAGAYAIQGGAARWIARMDGSPSGVIGLPLYTAWRLLKQAGYASKE